MTNQNNAAQAIQEAERIAAADEYFKARAWIMDTNDNRRIFEAGFDRAYALLSKLRVPLADERDRNATISQVVGLCNRIPGATTWNAAQFMYDEMHRRAALASAPVAYERAVQLPDDERAANTPIKAAYVDHFGHAAGWLSYKGSWFTEGFHAGRRAALASAPVAESTDRAMLQSVLQDLEKSESVCPRCGHSDSCADMDVVYMIRDHLKGDASAPVAGEAPSDAEVLKVYAETVAEYADGRGFEAGTVAFARSLLRRYAAPQASAEDVHNAALEEAAKEMDRLHAENRRWHNEFREAAAVVRALKQPQADKDGAPCSCPSGDGSLRHPCPMHPGADKDGGQWEPQTPEQIVAAMRRFARSEGFDWPDPRPAQGAGNTGEPIAWESTTPLFFKYVTDSKYRKFRPGVQKWYRPYRCASCAALSAPQAEQGERE